MLSLNEILVKSREQAEKIGEPGFMTTAFPEWKREYLYYIKPDDQSKDIDANLAQLMATANFESPRAKAFHAGWDHAIQRAKDGTNQIFAEYE